MKTLRKFFILILLFTILILPTKTANYSRLSTYSATFNNYTVFAEQEKWARVLNDNTPFFSDYSLKMIKFYLPRTYFIKVINAEDDVTRVIYMDGQFNAPFREGYVKTCDLFLFDGIPQNPYPEITLKLNCDEVLFADSKKQYPKTVLTQGTTALYYGDLTVENETFCYVYSNGYLGYVRKNAFQTFEVPLHHLPLKPENFEEDQKESSIHQSTNQNQNIVGLDSTMKIVVIIAVALVCVSVIYLLFKPRQTTDFKVAAWRDEDDF